ncbi:MAG: glycosyltransferase family 2 protein [Eubacteriales bacterium]|nr:glycosyltransferase family 2 protein [Eubacteriales bacterium]
MEPTVSVLVPVYNVEPYLRQCIDSIMGQTFSDFELILCDDGSTDCSGQICDTYAAKDSRVRVVHKKNEGLLWTRRVLLRHATGRYVLFVDSDDWIAPELLEKTVACAQRTGSDIVLFGYIDVTDGGIPRQAHADLYPDGASFFGEKRMELYQTFAVTGHLNHVWDKLILRSLFCEED